MIITWRHYLVTSDKLLLHVSYLEKQIRNSLFRHGHMDNVSITGVWWNLNKLRKLHDQNSKVLLEGGIHFLVLARKILTTLFHISCGLCISHAVKTYLSELLAITHGPTFVVKMYLQDHWASLFGIWLLFHCCYFSMAVNLGSQ